MRQIASKRPLKAENFAIFAQINNYSQTSNFHCYLRKLLIDRLPIEKLIGMNSIGPVVQRIE
jgi:hypothetical protein